MLIISLMGVMLILANHPMMGVIMLIGVTLIYFYLMFVSMGVLWFGLVLVLVMLSGVLVLFTYMASLSPNEKFENVGMILGLVLIMMLGTSSFGNYEYVNDWSCMTLKLWEGMNVYFMLFMLVVLLMVMFVVVQLVSKYGGALRVECEKKIS